LVFLAFAVALAQLAALTVEDLAGESMAGFDAVELGEGAPPVGLAVEVGKQVKGFRDPTEFGARAPGRGGPAAALQDAEDFTGADGAGGQAAGTLTGRTGVGMGSQEWVSPGTTDGVTPLSFGPG